MNRRRETPRGDWKGKTREMKRLNSLTLCARVSSILFGLPFSFTDSLGVLINVFGLFTFLKLLIYLDFNLPK